ncbi:winged helix-turn-helix transcriptional regulator [Gordonia sp. SL306]|uniref:winged helix-turn-helix transcriptional regulator n=1 Tax=Gordonia sp. SL306 TaxID=2995145 RepID=UPI00226FA658|nr:helix-turn-helix domain-containing protein [Gordonia sp. SL306]WAC53916.1 helix-turn-helix domain-containing protein [Gordonia sp. SL306]
MRRASFSHWPCSMARTADLVGDPWTALVLREAFYGTRRFDEFQRELGIARNTLTDRLRRLVDEGMLERNLYASEPIRHEYVLTDKGADFWDVLLAMSAWGDRWLADDAGPPLTLRHTACGHETRARVVCEHCGEAMPIEESRMSFGPGYPVRLRERPDVKARFDRMSHD